jgi:hypothetical protein
MLKHICALLLFTVLAIAADESCTCQVSVETSQGSGTPTIVLQQEGEKTSGTVKGNATEFGFEGDAGGQTLKDTYKGTIESPTR